jgi:hypothetical protein
MNKLELYSAVKSYKQRKQSGGGIHVTYKITLDRFLSPVEELGTYYKDINKFITRLRIIDEDGEVEGYKVKRFVCTDNEGHAVPRYKGLAIPTFELRIYYGPDKDKILIDYRGHVSIATIKEDPDGKNDASVASPTSYTVIDGQVWGEYEITLATHDTYGGHILSNILSKNLTDASLNYYLPVQFNEFLVTHSFITRENKNTVATIAAAAAIARNAFAQFDNNKDKQGRKTAFGGRT